MLTHISKKYLTVFTSTASMIGFDSYVKAVSAIAVDDLIANSFTYPLS